MLDFLDTHIGVITATTLSYATEKLPAAERRAWQQRRRDARRNA